MNERPSAPALRLVSDRTEHIAASRARFEPTLSPRFLNYVHQFLLDHRIPPGPVFAACELDPEQDGENDSPVPVAAISRLFQHAAQVSERPYFGLELSSGYHYESSSMLIMAVMAAPTVREALNTLVRYDKYVDSAIEINLDRAGGLACFEFNLLASEKDPIEQLAEYLNAFIASALRKATRIQVPIAHVAFKHRSQKEVAPIERFFGARVAYGATHNAFHFDEAFLNAPLRSSSALLYEVLCSALRTYYTEDGGHFDFMQAVHREVLRQFRTHVPNAASIADGLQLSQRTLRRRLADHGTKLQDVKNEARRQRAEFYLRNTALPLTDIALELGFSELSAFSRAFKDWTGATPQSYRLND